MGDQLSSFMDQSPILDNVSELKIRQPALRLAKQFAGAALTQVLLSQLESVAAVFHHRQPTLALLRGVIRNEDAVRLVFATADPPPELVQLREAKSIRVFDQHDCGVGNIDSNLYHAGRQKRIDLAVQKTTDDILFFVRLQSAMH